MRRLLLAWVAAALASACQGPGVPSEELASRPIAVAWRDPESARQRAERLGRAPEAAGGTRSRGGTATADQLQGYLEGLLGVPRQSRELETSYRLALLDPRSAEVEPLPSARKGSRPEAWSPDHQRLLYAQSEGSDVQLYELDIESGEVRQLTQGPGLHPRGCYGPEGRLVLMLAGWQQGKPASRIALTEPGGLNARVVSDGPRDHSPACAPDGSAIAYVSVDRRGRDQLFAIDLSGEDRSPRRLGPGRQPSFTPDGRWIVFSAQIQDHWQLWRIRPDGTGRSRIGTGVLDEGDPAVSPDGRHVVYVVEEQFREFLYLRRLDGSGDRILFRTGDSSNPVW